MRRLTPILAVLLALAVTGSAHAAVTASQITSPGDPLQRTWDLSAGQGPFGVAVAGTATLNSSGTNRVDLRCYFSGGVASGILATLTVDNTARTFSGPIDASLLTRPCLLRAIPAGSAPTTFTAYPGVRVYPTALTDTRVTNLASPNAGTLYDVYDHVVMPDRTSHFALGALGGCGLYYARPLDPGADPSLAGLDVFNCAGWADFTADGTPQSRSDIQVDGRNAFTGGMLQSSQLASGGSAVMDTLPGMPGLTAQRSIDPLGNYTLNESSDVVRCGSELPSYPPATAAAAASCGDLVGSGVRYARDVQSSDDGRVVTITDRWSSTDGAPHTLDLLLEQDMGSTAYGLQIPWVGPDFKGYGGGDSIGASPSAPGAIFVKSDATRADSTATPVGAIVYDTAPDGVEFYDDGKAISAYPQLRYVRSVPASGQLTIRHAYVIGTNLETVRALAAREADRFGGPSVSLTAPTSTTTPKVTVTGSATDNGGVRSLSVNGLPVAIAADGTWNATIALGLGANTVTAVAIDTQGNAAQASVAVTYAPATATKRAQCVVPSITGLTRTAARKKLKKTTCTLGKASWKYFKPHRVKKGRKRILVSYRLNRIVTQRVKTGSKVAGGTAIRVTLQGHKHPKKVKKK